MFFNPLFFGLILRFFYSSHAMAEARRSGRKDWLKDDEIANSNQMSCALKKRFPLGSLEEDPEGVDVRIFHRTPEELALSLLRLVWHQAGSPASQQRHGEP
jgi:hypothetical protein